MDACEIKIELDQQTIQDEFEKGVCTSILPVVMAPDSREQLQIFSFRQIS